MRRYECVPCGVMGAGDACWCCGSEVLRWGAIPHFTSSHDYRTLRPVVDVFKYQAESELDRLI